MMIMVYTILIATTKVSRLYVKSHADTITTTTTTTRDRGFSNNAQAMGVAPGPASLQDSFLFTNVRNVRENTIYFYIDMFIQSITRNLQKYI